ncbi:MAG: acyltransferase [Bacteroidetes bacterium]|nr:acyltransferase [Bacteroidota bacterium]
MTTKYPSLNGLRAISIVLVICHHLSGQYHIFEQAPKNYWVQIFINFIQDGSFGVNVFFIISGFLITSLLLKEESVCQKISLKNFYIRRTLRIFPAYYFLLLVYFVLQCFNVIHLHKYEWLTALTYTKYFNWIKDWNTSHAWSLSIEEQFYLLWPFVFMGGARLRKTVAWLVIIIVPCIRAALSTSPDWWIYDFWFFARIDAIVMGCLFALYQKEIVARLQNYWIPVFYAALLLIITIPLLPGFISGPVFSYWYHAIGLSYGTLVNLSVAVVMMYSIFGKKRLWFVFLNNPVMNYIGILSYSIYLWQQLFTNCWIDSWFFKFPNNLVSILIMALFSHYVIEKPFLKLKSRFSSV